MQHSKNNGSNVPNLRFSEFKGEWEEIELKDVCTFFSGGTPTSTNREYYDGHIPFIRSGEINSDRTELLITEAAFNFSSAKMVTIGDLLIALYGATSGEIGICKINGAINQAILCVKTSQNKMFLKFIWGKSVKLILKTYLQGGQGNLSAEIIKRLKFFFSKDLEQEKIAEFLTLIDERISTQNKIIEKLESLIKGMRDVLFCEDQNKPQLRFPKHQEGWGKVKLKGLVHRINRKNKDNETQLALTIAAQFGLVDQTTFFNKQIASIDMSKYYLLHNGEFAYNKSYSKDYPWGAVKRLDLYDMGALSTLYICFKPLNNINSDYLVHYFESTKWYKGISEIAGEGARNHGLLNISLEDYFSTIHYIPSDEEQKEIAEFLNLYSNKISTEQKTLSCFLVQKQYLLSNMFI